MNKRVIFDIPRDYQMAIRLRAVKWECSNGEVIEEAVRRAFPAEMAEAEEATKVLNQPKETKK